MTNINCNNNCLYQNDGKCTLDKVDSTIIAGKNSGCLYQQVVDKKNTNQKLS